MGRGLYKRKIQRKLEAEQAKQSQSIKIEEPMDTAPVPQFTIKINHPSLRIRKAPDSGAEIVGLITDQGIYDVYKTIGDWGQLADGNWIMLSYTVKIKDS